LRVSEYDTPFLLLDVDAVDRNIRRMGDYFRGTKSTHRPHVKVHKSPWLAQKQIDAGAKGITCAKVSEAEVMVDGGIDDIFIANEIVGEDKVRRLVTLAKRCKLSVIVDSVENARQISSLAALEGAKVGVLIDVNLGVAVGGILDRTGVAPGREALTLAQEVSRLPQLDLRGVSGYEGALKAFDKLEAKVQSARKAMGVLVETAQLISDSGLSVSTVSGGGTTSYKTVAEFPGVTEVQAGGYLFMDLGYRQSGIDFETSLSLLTRVVSTPRPGKAIVDAGFKAISADSGLPEVRDRADLEIVSLNAEHGHMKVNDLARSPKRGERLELLPYHADTTTCLHDDYVLTRSGEVTGTVKIEARGKLQ
jgi:D-serine deaminase-like pyridoxal phosphate-dependent protein